MNALKFIGKMLLVIAAYLLLNVIINFSTLILDTYQDFFAWVACIVMIGTPIAIIVWLTKGSK